MLDDKWLLTTIKRVVKDLGVHSGVNYIGEEIPEYRSLYGRVIIKHKKTRSHVRWAKEIYDDLEVLQVLPTVYEGWDFPGYDRVRLTFLQLDTVISRQKRDWIAALKNQKAVDLLVDMHAGQQYVGAAYGDNGMLLQPWSAYAANGHGDNKLLHEIVDSKGFDYVKANFQYALLENYNARVDKKIITDREAWWKKTLGSRTFGLNGN